MLSIQKHIYRYHYIFMCEQNIWLAPFHLFNQHAKQPRNLTKRLSSLELLYALLGLW